MAGLLLVAFGLAGVWMALDLRMGTAVSMGPGYFPLMIFSGVALLGVVVLMIVFATQQVVEGANDLADQVVAGLDQIREWLRDGPLHATDQQIDDAIQSMQDLVVSSNEELVGRVTTVGTGPAEGVAAAPEPRRRMTAPPPMRSVTVFSSRSFSSARLMRATSSASSVDM